MAQRVAVGVELGRGVRLAVGVELGRDVRVAVGVGLGGRVRVAVGVAVGGRGVRVGVEVGGGGVEVALMCSSAISRQSGGTACSGRASSAFHSFTAVGRLPTFSRVCARQ